MPIYFFCKYFVIQKIITELRLNKPQNLQTSKTQLSTSKAEEALQIHLYKLMNLFYIAQPVTWVCATLPGPTCYLPVIPSQNLQPFVNQRTQTSASNLNSMGQLMPMKAPGAQVRAECAAQRQKTIQRDESQKKPLRQQNTSRNTFTNLGNQVITFASISKKSRSTLERLCPSLTDDEITRYYQYATQLRKTINGYINLGKLKKLWGTKPEQSLTMYQVIFVKLNVYYLRQISIPALLTSRKLKKDVLSQHLSTRRILLKVIKNIQ